MDTIASDPICLEAVSKSYGAKDILREVDLSVRAGECLALVGHNGAGKTTLMKLVLGLTRPSHGRIRVLGEDLAAPAAADPRRLIGFLPESVAFHQAMTGREVLTFYARLKRQKTDVCDTLLARFGLADAANQRVGTYSKGMRQRLGLAQAILGAPRLLLFDEPTTGLDPRFRRTFFELLADQREAGTTALICSHALTEIEARADRVAIMSRGRLVACGTLDELRQAAELPVRVRVSVTPGEAGRIANEIGASVELRKVNDTVVDLTCLGPDKMSVVRRIAALGEPVEDLEIRPPRLEEIYEYFTSEGDAP